MLKKRLIGTILIRQGIAVQSIGFSRYLPIGRAEIAAEYFNRWGIDEIILLDIDASRNNRCIDPDLVRRVARECMVPLTVGGGIRSIENIQMLIHAGADKVAINSKAWETPDFLAHASAVFGKQCLILSCDLQKMDHNAYTIVHHSLPSTSLGDVMEEISRVAGYGAGEILLQSCERDGQQNGYDLEVLTAAATLLSSPLIALGGAGDPHHFEEALAIGGIDAVAAANYFHFFEHSVVLTKNYLHKKDPSQIRQDTQYDYAKAADNHLTRYAL